VRRARERRRAQDLFVSDGVLRTIVILFPNRVVLLRRDLDLTDEGRGNERGRHTERRRRDLLDILHQLIDIKSLFRDMSKERENLLHGKGREVRSKESQES
jgi:hypothetical protein